MNEDGVITIASEFSARETVDRLVSTIASKGFVIFAQIDHAANAIKIGMALHPTELIIFGNPKVGTFLMQDKQTIGLDLPVKILVWEDADSRVWLSHYATTSLTKQHDLGTQSAASIETIESVLVAVSKAAATR